MNTLVKRILDALGVIAPTICVVHCLATPILLTALPFLPGAKPGHEDNDTLFHWIIVGICAVAILPALWNHKKTRVLLLFVAGAACILIPAYVSIEPYVPHIAVAIVGSICLVSANLLNRKYAQTAACCNHAHIAE